MPNQGITKSVCVLLVSVTIIYQVIQFSPSKLGERRLLSIKLGSEKCQRTYGQPGGKEFSAFGTLIASFPASGMHFTWQSHIEGLKGVTVGDDYDFPTKTLGKRGIMKTQYPHLEGIWSWGDKMDQVVLLVRNPRLAIPSYHTHLYEKHYAHDWETAHKYYKRLFSTRPSVDEWMRWRDYRFHEEVILWKWFVDYWMEGGKQYWMDWDFERNGQLPFDWLDKKDRKTDLHCIYELDCYPKAVLSYELLSDPVTRHFEAEKVATIMEDKLGIEIIAEDTKPCILTEIEKSKSTPDIINKDEREHLKAEYSFTYTQLNEINDMLVGMKGKYGSDKWDDNTAAQDLVMYLDAYIDDLSSCIKSMKNDTSPTPSPNEDNQKNVISWYKSIGRGDRYNKDRIQKMAKVWPSVRHLYN